MTKFLSDVLGVDQAVFAARIARLEQATLNQGIDIKLTASIHSDTKQKLLELGLDPNDTTSAELSHALQIRAIADNNQLLKKLGLSEESSSVDVMKKLGTFVGKKTKKHQVITVKNKVLKKIFTDNVPQKTMKLLRYRTVTSLLKREHPHELYVLAQLLESDSYKKKLQLSLRQLKASDYEEGALQILCVDEQRWGHIKNSIKKHIVPIFSFAEVGTVAILPIHTQNTPCLALLSSALLFKEIKHVKQMSSYVKVRMLDPSFHQHLDIINQQGQSALFHITDTPVHWHHVHTLIGNGVISHDFGPHITESDMTWFGIEAELAGIDENLGFWIGTHRLAYLHNKFVVSLHVIDVCFSVMFKQDYLAASKIFVRQSIHDELLQEYLKVPPYIQLVHDQIIKIADTSAELMYYEA